MNGRSSWILRTVGAIGILIGGALHTNLAFDGYGTDNVVRLFFVNGIVSAIAAAWLALDDGPLSAVAGVAVSAASLLTFALSRVGEGIVGFRGEGLDPSPEGALTVASEVAVVLVLGVLLFIERTTVRDLLLGRADPSHSQES